MGQRGKMLDTDGPTPKFLYAIIRQLDLKNIDWNRVATELQISNGHAARMRYSRFKNQMEGALGNRPKKRTPKKVGKEGFQVELTLAPQPMTPPTGLILPKPEPVNFPSGSNPFIKYEPDMSNLDSEPISGFPEFPPWPPSVPPVAGSNGQFISPQAPPFNEHGARFGNSPGPSSSLPPSLAPNFAPSYPQYSMAYEANQRDFPLQQTIVSNAPAMPWDAQSSFVPCDTPIKIEIDGDDSQKIDKEFLTKVDEFDLD